MAIEIITPSTEEAFNALTQFVNDANRCIWNLKTAIASACWVEKHCRRLRKLEAVAEAARKLMRSLPPYTDYTDIVEMRNAAAELQEALRALEGGEQNA